MAGGLVVEVLNFKKNSDKWLSVNDFLELRKRVFRDRLGWDLSTHGDLEFEQYDNFGSYYVIASRGDLVLGGARLIRTDTVQPARGRVRYTYMIKDAYDGRLQGLPMDISSAVPPVADDVWEFTRFVSAAGENVGREVISRTYEFLQGQGAKSVWALSSPAVMRLVRMSGLKPERLGVVHRSGGEQFVAFRCAVCARDV